MFPPGKRSLVWNRAVRNGELQLDDLAATHIVGAYYAWVHW